LLRAPPRERARRKGALEADAVRAIIAQAGNGDLVFARLACKNFRDLSCPLVAKRSASFHHCAAGGGRPRRRW
jgi:hypothetical protein